jgi:hypothetical protein
MTDKLSPTLPEAAQEAIDAIAGLTGTIPEDKLDALMAAYGSLRRAMHSLSASGDVELIKGALAANLDLSDELLIELQASGNLDETATAIAALTASGNSGTVSDDLPECGWCEGIREPDEVCACNAPDDVRVVLQAARDAIASLDEFALGGVDITDFITGDHAGQYGIRDELLARIDAALLNEGERS